ncbi:heterogeneous nuclear ribonucleoprotein Q-like [Miscanthus floridulus]|uniref:heterogeneous nuclear ribonucleoprotein Q-like n=1 Tax=Miscanthus floridulus TaxID=154761 RepID=UPI00345984A2
MASSPPRAPRRFLFDLNVAQEEVEEEEPMEVLEEEGAPVAQPEEAVVEEVAEQLVEHAVPTVEEEEPVEEVIMEEEPSEEVIMEEEEEPAPAPAGEVIGEGKGRKNRIDYEVFVSGLPQDAAEEDVAKALAEAGDVEEVRLVRDPADQRLKGFAFVRFAAAWQARWAANDLREAAIKGKACGICKNSENETLHVRNICFDWSKDDLAEKLEPFKLENLDRINLIEHPEKKGKNRGYAFLDFRTHVDAVAAFVKLQKRDLYLGTDFRAHISFSNTLSQDDEIMEKVKSVFLDGLPPHWDEDKVREMFGKFGEIDSIQLARNMFTAKRKDFGFIGFTTRQSALDCIKMVNKDGVGEGSGKVLIKASLQRPRHAFKKNSWQGSSSLLGVRRGFVEKSYSGRGHHSDRYRHYSPERRSYSDNHSRRHRSIDVEERHTSVRGYRAYYRRDSPVHAPNYKYGRIREEYAERRYTSKYPKHRQAMHETMEQDAYRRNKYGHSYQERAHRTCPCPECNLSGQNCNYSNGEEFSAISGCEQAYYKTDRDLTPSTSQVASHCEDSCCKGQQLMPKSSSVMCDCDECYINQEPTPSPSEHARTRSNLPVPLHHQLGKHSNEHGRHVDDAHSAFEVEYTVRESRSRYLSSKDAPSTHSRKHHRSAR